MSNREEEAWTPLKGVGGCRLRPVVPNPVRNFPGILFYPLGVAALMLISCLNLESAVATAARHSGNSLKALFSA